MVVCTRKLIKDVIYDYAVAFCKRLQRCFEPGCSAFATDIDIPFASYEETLSAMTEQVRHFLGLAAVTMLQEKNLTWKTGVFDSGGNSGVEELVEEIVDNRSTVVVTSTGDVQRVVDLACLRIQRSDDSRIFAHLGKVRGRKVLPQCALPGTKIKDGELPSYTLAPLLSDGELQMFSGALNYGVETREADWQWSKRFGLFTKYTRHIQHATVVDALCRPDHMPLTTYMPNLKALSTLTGPVFQQGQSRLEGLEPFLTYGSPAGPYISTWMTPREYDFWRLPSNQQSLSKWLQNLPIEAALAQAEAEWGGTDFCGNSSYI